MVKATRHSTDEQFFNVLNNYAPSLQTEPDEITNHIIPFCMQVRSCNIDFWLAGWNTMSCLVFNPNGSHHPSVSASCAYWRVTECVGDRCGMWHSCCCILKQSSMNACVDDDDDDVLHAGINLANYDGCLFNSSQKGGRSRRGHGNQPNALVCVFLY